MIRAVRVILVVQAVCLIGFLATVFPSFLQRITTPPVDCDPQNVCFDPTGAAFAIYFLIFAPLVGVLVLVAWLWRTDVKWPAIVTIPIALLLIGGGLSDVTSPRQPDVLNAPAAAELLLVVVPAFASLAVLVAFVAVLTWQRRNEGGAEAPRAQNFPS